MPILDTVVIFAVADDKDRFHRAAKAQLSRLSSRTRLASFALTEFDVVLRSRGYSVSQRARELLLLLRDYPRSASAVHAVSPSTFVLASGVEGRLGLDYFDSLVAAEALQHDGRVVSSDREFDRVPGLKRIPL